MAPLAGESIVGSWDSVGEDLKEHQRGTHHLSDRQSGTPIPEGWNQRWEHLVLLWTHKSQRACVCGLALLASCLTPAKTMGTFPEAQPHAGTAVVFSVFYGTFHCPMSLCLPIRSSCSG